VKVLLLGSTGPTGRDVLDRLIVAGHEVLALVRDPDRLGGYTHPLLETTTGDATRPGDVVRAAHGRDAVIATLGTGTSLRSHGLFENAASAITEAVRAASVPRLVWLSSFGVGSSFSAASLVQKGIYSTLLRGVYADKAVAEDIIRRSSAEWTIVHPTRLTDGPETGAYAVAESLPMAGKPTISRQDVAHFIVSSLEDAQWFRRTAVVSG
jgi:uncharacterized protein YbjT (DUF2867 family)